MVLWKNEEKEITAYLVHTREGETITVSANEVKWKWTWDGIGWNLLVGLCAIWNLILCILENTHSTQV